MPGEPNKLGGKEHCIIIWPQKDYKWNDAPRETKFYFVCEKDEYEWVYQKPLIQKLIFIEFHTIFAMNLFLRCWKKRENEN